MARKSADKSHEDSQKAKGEAEAPEASDQASKGKRAPQMTTQGAENTIPEDEESDEEELGEDDRDYEAETEAAQRAPQGVQQTRQETRGPLPGGVSEPASSPGGGPPRLGPEAAAEEARKIAREGEGKDEAGAAVQAAETVEGDMPTLERDVAALRAAVRKITNGDPARQSQVPGQPAVEDPNRAPTSTESALNQEAIARKGDSAPMHPSQNAGAGNEPITLQVEATRPDEERKFRVVSGMVGGFRVGPNGEPSGWVGLKQMNITAEMVPRLIQKGVIEEQQ